MLTNVFGGGREQLRVEIRQGGSRNVNKSKNKKSDEMKIQRATRERNRARKEINARTTGNSSATTQAIDESNAQRHIYYCNKSVNIYRY